MYTIVENPFNSNSVRCVNWEFHLPKKVMCPNITLGRISFLSVRYLIFFPYLLVVLQHTQHWYVCICENTKKNPFLYLFYGFIHVRIRKSNKIVDFVPDAGTKIDLSKI